MRLSITSLTTRSLVLPARERLAIRRTDRLQSRRTQSGIVNTLRLKAIRLLAGGEAKIGGTLASVIFGAARLHFTEEVFLRVARIDLLSAVPRIGAWAAYIHI